MERGFVLALGIYAWHGFVVAIQTLLLLPAMFPGSPVDLLATHPASTHENTTLTYAGGDIHVDLFRPTTGGRHGALVLLLGAGDLPRIDLAYRFADALARSGVVVMLPQSDGLLSERITYAEVDGIRSELRALDGESDVDTSRVGLVGLSAAGGLCIVAAAEPDLRDRIAFVNSFGSYSDARSLIVDVASRSILVDNQMREWAPEDRTIEVVAASLVAALPVGADGLLVQQVLQGANRDEAEQGVAALPAQTQEKLQQISPSAHLQDITARLYLMHDLDDTYIPFTESRAIVSAASHGLVERYTEFSIFAHVIPERSVPWRTFLPDLWRLFWHVHAVMLEVV
ncbi:MAG: hypothetical protein JOZ81_29575 [Chloroflexi bacterium]|nr:hypothetical protein [Chloroflexota bacterium]